MASNSLEPVVEPPPGVKTEPDKGTSWHDSPSGSDKSTTPKEEDSFCEDDFLASQQLLSEANYISPKKLAGTSKFQFPPLTEVSGNPLSHVAITPRRRSPTAEEHSRFEDGDIGEMATPVMGKKHNGAISGFLGPKFKVSKSGGSLSPEVAKKSKKKKNKEQRRLETNGEDPEPSTYVTDPSGGTQDSFQVPDSQPVAATENEERKKKKRKRKEENRKDSLENGESKEKKRKKDKDLRDVDEHQTPVQKELDQDERTARKRAEKQARKERKRIEREEAKRTSSNKENAMKEDNSALKKREHKKPKQATGDAGDANDIEQPSEIKVSSSFVDQLPASEKVPQSNRSSTKKLKTYRSSAPSTYVDEEQGDLTASGARKTSTKRARDDGTIQPSEVAPESASSQVSRVERSDPADVDNNDTPQVNSRLPSYGPFAPEEKDIVERALIKFGREYGLNRTEINELVQNTERGKVTLRDELWDVLKQKLPNRNFPSITKFARRVYHNFETSGGAWTEEEDEQLKRLAAKMPTKWKDIAAILNRRPTDVRDRWRNYTKYDSSQRIVSYWTQEEEDRFRVIIDEKLTSIFQDYLDKNDGENEADYTKEDFAPLLNWDSVAAGMGGTRSRLQCSQKWKTLCKADDGDVRPRTWIKQVLAGKVQPKANEGPISAIRMRSPAREKAAREKEELEAKQRKKKKEKEKEKRKPPPKLKTPSKEKTPKPVTTPQAPKSAEYIVDSDDDGDDFDDADGARKPQDKRTPQSGKSLAQSAKSQKTKKAAPAIVDDEMSQRMKAALAKLNATPQRVALIKPASDSSNSRSSSCEGDSDSSS